MALDKRSTLKLVCNHHLILKIFIVAIMLYLATFVMTCYTKLLNCSMTDICNEDNTRTQVKSMLTSHQLFPYEERNRSIQGEIPDFSKSDGLLYSMRVKGRKKQPLSDFTQEQEQCKETHCPEFLKGDDISRWLKCTYLARKVAQNISSQISKCSFIDQSERDPVALVSLPGSGNTWVRGLLEEATGLCTGAVYCDISLRANGFTGEFIRSGRALTVKTHFSFPKWVPVMQTKSEKLKENSGIYGSAILIVRDPFRALVSEWNRKVANKFRRRTTELDSHTKAAGREWFGKNSMWNEFVYKQTPRWESTIIKWFIFNDDYPVLVVKYEALKNDTFSEVERMLKFMNIEYDSKKMKEKLGSGYNTFHRKRGPEEFQRFTEEQRIFVNDTVKNIKSLLDSSEKGKFLNVNQYISKE